MRRLRQPSYEYACMRICGATNLQPYYNLWRHNIGRHERVYGVSLRSNLTLFSYENTERLAEAYKFLNSPNPIFGQKPFSVLRLLVTTC